MNREFTRRLALAVTVIPICLLTYALQVEGKPFFATSVAGTFLIHMWTRPSRREYLLTLGIASLLFVAFVLGRREAIDGLTAATLTVGACLGLGSLAVTSAQAIWRTGKEREAKLRLFLPVLLMILSSVIGALALLSTATLHPRTYDLFLYAFDATLGFQASFWMGRVFGSHALLAAAGGAVYAGVPLAISLLYAIQITNPRRAPIDILYVFFAAGFVGLVLYHFFPATGPIFVFGGSFPQNPPPVDGLTLIAAAPDAPRNAMPSVHTAWALLVWWNSGGRPVWVRTLAAGFLALTLLTTLGLGEHYLIDLVVAVPFTAALQAAFRRGIPLNRPARSRTLAVCSILTILWLIALRTSIPMFQRWPALSWAAILCTLAASVFFERRLAAAADEERRSVEPALVVNS